jgi:signal transduction histidine kinase/CheY-like chemotaxis protein/HPt (histidine-containing phosphotransfer) domain-containing protein
MRAVPELEGFLLATIGLGDIVQTLRVAGTRTDFRLALVNGSGEVLFASNPELEGTELSADQLGRLRASPTNAPVRTTETKGRAAFTQLFRLHPNLSLVASLPEEVVLHETRNLGLVVGLITLGAVTGVAGLLVYGLRRMVLHPVARLRAVARVIGDGELSAPVVADSRDELGELASALDAMRSRLLASRESIARYQAELEEKVIASEQASRAKSEFLARMSHEIRTPMNGILGVADILGETPLNPRQHQLVETVQRSGTALLSVINDILDFSKIEAGRMTLQETGFDVYRLVEEVVELFGEQGGARGVEMAAMLQPSVPREVVGDPSRLRQVLMNLVGNGVKFTANGHVTVVAFRRGDDSPTIRFEVNDSGIGMTPEVLERVFDSFQQGDGSSTRQFGGTGLGLTIARELVRMMDGEIGASSEPGVGSRFWFEVPLLAASQQGPSPAPDWAGEPILIVEDNPGIRRALCDQLAPMGWSPKAVADAEETLGALAQASRSDHPFRVCLLDESMPGMGGISLARRIRSRTDLGTPRLILMSAAIGAESEDLMDLGFHGRLSKPLKTTELISSLTATLKQGPLPSTRPQVTPAPALPSERGPPTARDAGPATAAVPVGADPPNALPTLDREALDEIRNLGKPGLLAKVFAAYRQDAVANLAKLRAAIAAADPEQVYKTAHSIKSASGNVGAARLAAAARELEQYGRKADLTQAEHLGQVIETEFGAVETAMSAFTGERDQALAEAKDSSG